MPLYPPIGGALAPDDPLASRFDAVMGNQRPPINTAPQGDPMNVEPSYRDMDLPSFAPAVKEPYQRIQDQPGGRNALLAFGAAMLSGRNFWDGFGKAGLAYGNALSAEEQKNRPQISKDGNFQYKWNPQTEDYDFEETAAGLRARQMATEKLQTTSGDRRYAADKGYDGKVYVADKTDAFKRDELPYRDRWEDGKNAARIEAARLAGQYGIERARVTGENQQNKPPPAGIVNLVTEKQTIASKARTTLGQIDRVLHNFPQLGAWNNLWNKVKQGTGVLADDESRSYAELQRVLQALSNTKLLDAKGVQTEGDAVRAKIESLISSGDTQGAYEEFTRAREALQTTADLSLAQADDLTEQYGINNERTRAVVEHSGAPAPRRPAPARTGSTAGVKWRIVQ